ncbi:MAG: L-histidine N(alpha)-methyltransferase [Bacteroidales bacterium]
MTAPRDLDHGFREAVLRGLSRRPRAIPCQYLYDTEGSALFERITELDEYYPTRTEIALLHQAGADIAARVGAHARVVEFGCGAMRKTRLLLSALDRPAAYVAIDVAREPLLLGARRLGALYPDLTVVPLVADFTRPLVLPPECGQEGPALGFFPGSTIGNMRPTDARAFLCRAGHLLGPGGWMLVGVDLIKDTALLDAAYDDSQGVTAAFIRNVLARANRELGADFDPDGFDHRAWWNAREGRVEIHLVAARRQVASIDGHRFAFRRGDVIHIEDCYKYGVEQFHWLARLAGFTPEAVWVDDARLFSLHLLARSGG